MRELSSRTAALGAGALRCAAGVRALPSRVVGAGRLGRGVAARERTSLRRLPTETTPPLARLRIIFPEGFTRREMAERVAAVREIAIDEAGRHAAADRAGLPAGDRAARAAGRVPEGLGRDGRSRGSSSRRRTSSASTRLGASSCATSSRPSGGSGRRSTSAMRARRTSRRTTCSIIASMIEKETVAPEERRLVAAVIYNRLRHRMPLGIDATIRYGRDVPGTEPLKQSDLESDNPYNTRKRLGLPPTPIANPGLASMRAAANPARVDYLYFVRKPDGVHHFFTASESEFFRKKCEYGFGC